MTQGQQEMMMRWHQHFRKILNEPSVYRDEVIEDMPELPSRIDLDVPPTTAGVCSVQDEEEEGW